jgi:ribulose-5-phosphate 4-epimerase/fuculose-1-phosphate aldolase
MQVTVHGGVSKHEWQARLDLAAAYRAMALYGWDDLVFTHLSARVPGRGDHFLINPYGMLFEEITASSLVKIDLNGDKVLNSPYEANPAGFIIHSAIHGARADAACVVHLQTTAGVAVSCQASGLLPISQQAMFVLPGLGYHDYEGVAIEPDERQRLVDDLGGGHSLILRNHGVLTCAQSVADAFMLSYVLQRACEIQLQAQAGGGHFADVAPDVIGSVRRTGEHAMRDAGGSLVWPGLLRKLDRIDASWRL